MARSAAARETADVIRLQRIVRGKRGGPHFYATLLGLKGAETVDLVGQVEAGFPYAAFERLQRNLDLRVEELALLVQIKPRTLARRREQERFTPEESDRLLRAARVFGKALALFEGDVEAARTWFATRAPALANRAPRELATTEVGSREVENLIGRLEHGVFS